MDLYLLLKTLHILSSTVLFGTGAGIAYLMLSGYRSGVPAVRRFAAAATVRGDLLFTTPAVIVQPLSGAWLVWRSGVEPTELWLIITYALYLLAGACWLPVVAIQIRIRRMLGAGVEGGGPDEVALSRLFRWWFALGWPAFGALIVIFYLMVAKPTW